MCRATSPIHVDVLDKCKYPEKRKKGVQVLKFIYATIITAIVSGVFLTFFPVLLAEELTLAKVLFYVIMVMVWSTLVAFFARRDRKRRQL